MSDDEINLFGDGEELSPVNDLQNKIHDLIEDYGDKYDLTIAETLGVLYLVQQDLYHNALE